MRSITLILAVFPAFCQPAETLDRVFRALGDPGGRVLHMQDIDGVEQDYQSSAPFITIFHNHESWTDPRTGAERVVTETGGLGSSRGNRGTAIFTVDGVYAVRDTAVTRLPGVPGNSRWLNLWAALATWRGANELRLAAPAVFNGYTRTVLVHRGQFGHERLFIDPKTELPVKLDREEPHYLWGQVHVEYEYLYWHRDGGVMVPAAIARVVDGFKEITRTVGKIEWIEATTAPSLAVPDVPAPAGDGTAAFLQQGGVRKVDLAEKMFLTVNPGYTEAFALVGDTVYIFDTTQGEARARQDLAQIEETFGKGHKYVVVVTDLAWPHVAGVRFWVAQGATIVSHRESRAFLEKVVARRWTRSPDLLEQRRTRAKLNFVAVDKELALADGAVKLYAIDGISSEGALMAWLPAQRVLWASDYIQSVRGPSQYTTEVCEAVKRAGIAPERVIAQHIPVTAWDVVAKLCGQ